MNGEVIDGVALLMHAEDTVATALEPLEAERELDVDGRTITIGESVPFGHKFALRPIDAGERVRKYGEVIATAEERIEAGGWVHTHNCRSTRGRGDLAAPGAASGGERT